MSNLSVRIDDVMERTQEIADQREAEQAAFEADHPLVCRECGEPLPQDFPLRNRAYAAFRRDGRWPRYLSCLACREKERRERERAEAERKRAEAEQVAARREAELANVRENLGAHLRRMGVPRVLRGARFDRCPDLPGELIDQVCRWAGEPRGFLVLLGSPGSGKSWLAAAALADAVTSGRYRPDGCRFLVEADWLATVRIDFGAVVSDPVPMRSRLLVWDDLGSGYLNDVRVGEIERTIRARHADGRPTIFTTNFSGVQIGETLGGRVLSVLREGGRLLKVPAHDLRLKGGIRPTRL